MTLVDKARTHIWKPLLHEIAAGSMDVGRHELDYLAQAHWHGFRYRYGELTGLDRANKLIHLAATFDEEGRPISGAKVEVSMHWRDGEALARSLQQRPCVGTWLAEGNDEPCGARMTDHNGRWTLDNVPAGDVHRGLRASTADRGGESAQAVDTNPSSPPSPFNDRGDHRGVRRRKPES